MTEGEEVLRSSAAALTDGIVTAIPTWVVRSVERLCVAWAGRVGPEVAVAAEAAGQAAAADAGGQIRDLLALDIDEQRTTPLAILRGAVRYPTEVLRDAGVPVVERDSYAEKAFPDDVYALTPASLADIDPALAEIGIVWGAAKAFEHKARHRGA